jgi:hypothetical protein
MIEKAKNAFNSLLSYVCNCWDKNI